MIFPSFPKDSFNSCLFKVGVISSSSQLFGKWNAWSVGLMSRVWNCQFKMVHISPLIFVVLELYFSLLSGCMIKFLSNRLDKFFCKLADRMLLKSSEFSLLLKSWVTSSTNMNEPVPETATLTQAKILLLPSFIDENLCFASLAELFCLHTWLFLCISLQIPIWLFNSYWS